MPIVVDRRSFLKQAAWGLAAFQTGTLLPAAPADVVRWALLSDTHIAADRADSYRGFHPHENLRKVLDQVAAAPRDLVLVNGDLARQEGRPADYEVLTSYLDPVTAKYPLAVTLGNHDDRKNCRSALAQAGGNLQPVEKKFVATIDSGPVEFILLDSLMVTNIAVGQLGVLQRNWLASYLNAKSTKPAVIFVHHNLDPADDNALADAEQFLAVVTPVSRVKAIFYGHTHAWRQEKKGGLHLVNIPAVGYNFKDSEPVGWTEAEFSSKGATLKLNAIGGNTAANGAVVKLAWR